MKHVEARRRDRRRRPVRGQRSLRPAPSIRWGLADVGVGYVAAVALSLMRGSRDAVGEFGISVVWSDVPVGIAVGCAAQLLVVPAVPWPLQRILGGDVSASARELLGPAGAGRWVLGAAVITGAPLAEELFFRGLLLRSLTRHMTDVAAIGVSAVLFAATHLQLLPFPGLFASGVVFAVLVRRTGRLGPAIFAHAAFNATTVVALLI